MNPKYCANYWGWAVANQIIYHVWKPGSRWCKCKHEKW